MNASASESRQGRGEMSVPRGRGERGFHQGRCGHRPGRPCHFPQSPYAEGPRRLLPGVALDSAIRDAAAFYQIFTRTSSPRYILSPGFTPNAS